MLFYSSCTWLASAVQRPEQLQGAKGQGSNSLLYFLLSVSSISVRGIWIYDSLLKVQGCLDGAGGCDADLWHIWSNSAGRNAAAHGSGMRLHQVLREHTLCWRADHCVWNQPCQPAAAEDRVHKWEQNKGHRFRSALVFHALCIFWAC